MGAKSPEMQVIFQFKPREPQGSLADVCRHIVKLGDHGDDGATVIVFLEFDEPADPAGMFNVSEPEHGGVSEQLVSDLVSVDQIGRASCRERV